MTDKSLIQKTFRRLLVLQKGLKHTMVSGMTYVCLLSCISECMAIDSGGHASDYYSCVITA